ncbi:MAG TPA: dienelactone hydrolase family protein [Terriglobales bacterium]|nr:dienelactone hydrolase family protein [Terriglobales bacterium]
MIDGFRATELSHGGQTRTVYRRGTGPGVVIMHEIPGIYPAVIRFAETIADAGFSVALPHLFGEVGRPLSQPYIGAEMARACVSREFKVLAAHQASPITEWLRGLARAIHAEIGGRGVGAIGMCLTGNFALALMVDPFLMAPVLSQPSLPFPIGAERRAGLHVSPQQLEQIKQRTTAGCRVLGLRFTHDALCPGERFTTLRRELGQAFEGIEIDSGPGNAHGIPRSAHSVVTKDLVDREGHPTKQALDRLIAFLREQLL